jgi:hypothetical protein
VKKFLIIICAILLSSCSISDQYQDADSRQAALQSQIVEKEGENVQASIDSINADNPTLALRFDNAALQLLGAPKLHIDVSKLTTKAEQDAFFTKTTKDNEALTAQNAALTKEKSDLQIQLVQEAKAKEASDAKSLFWKILFSATGVLGIGGVIALCVFFPPLLPVIMEIAGNIAGMLYNVINSIISGIGSLLKKS